MNQHSDRVFDIESDYCENVIRKYENSFYFRSFYRNSQNCLNIAHSCLKCLLLNTVFDIFIQI